MAKEINTGTVIDIILALEEACEKWRMLSDVRKLNPTIGKYMIAVSDYETLKAEFIKYGAVMDSKASANTDFEARARALHSRSKNDKILSSDFDDMLGLARYMKDNIQI